jgi:hypothetical protein
MPTWPATLPQEQFLGLTEVRQDGRLRSQMDTGRPKMRRRFTSVAVRYQIPTLFTGAQKIIFDNFYTATLFEGTLPFTWEDPVNDVPRDFTFVEVPTFTLELGNPDPDLRLWSVTLSLERLP